MKAGTRVWSTHAPTFHATAFDRLMLAPLQRKLNQVSVRLVLWDGTSLYDSAEPPIATVEIRDRGMLMGLLRHRELAFGEGYSDERLTVHGNLVALLEAIYRHYAMTLKHWRSRFDEASDRILSMFDESFARAWRLYLAGSQAAFTTGWMQLFQVVFARGHSRDVPLARPRNAASVFPNQVNL
jgi:hypothetical protein